MNGFLLASAIMSPTGYELGHIMNKIVKQTKLEYINHEENSYKDWEIFLYENGDVETKWGRIGNNKQTKLTSGGGIEMFEKMISNKIKKGYFVL